MVDPGTVYAEMAYRAKQVLSELSEDELKEYKSAVELIATKYMHIDESLSGFNAKGKLSMIERMLEEE